MATLDSSVPCTVETRRRSMFHRAALAVVFAVALLDPLTVAVALARGESAPATVLVAAAGKININTADVNELMTLSGVKRSLAEKIVQHREANGLFKKPEDVRKVEGVGDALWKKNRARIVVK
jgi:competence protein ComEA